MSKIPNSSKYKKVGTNRAKTTTSPRNPQARNNISNGGLNSKPYTNINYRQNNGSYYHSQGSSAWNFFVFISLLALMVLIYSFPTLSLSIFLLWILFKASK